jgi:hypothetical protein
MTDEEYKERNIFMEKENIKKILDGRSFFISMLENALMRFEKTHPKLQCMIIENGAYMELRDRANQTLIGKWTIDELLCDAAPFSDEVEMAKKGCLKVLDVLDDTINRTTNAYHEFDSYKQIKKNLWIVGLKNSSARENKEAIMNGPHVRFGDMTFVVAACLHERHLPDSISALAYPALENWDISEEDLFMDIAEQEIENVACCSMETCQEDGSNAKSELLEYGIPADLNSQIYLMARKDSDDSCIGTILHPDFCRRVSLMTGTGGRFWAVPTFDLKGFFIGDASDHETLDRIVHSQTRSAKHIPLYICDAESETVSAVEESGEETELLTLFRSESVVC